MDYELVITDKAQEMLDDLVRYLLFDLCSRKAAEHLISSVQDIYQRLRLFPLQFPLCEDYVLRGNGYRKAVLADMSYILIFTVEDQAVYVLGIFHELENYGIRL